MPASPTREELYSLVWSKPMRDLAAQFGISDRALAKRCRRLKVPYPGRGYWQKLAAGKRVQRRPLPRLDPVDEAEKAAERARYRRRRLFRTGPVGEPYLRQRRGVYYLLWFDRRSKSTVRRSMRTTDAEVAEQMLAFARLVLPRCRDMFIYRGEVTPSVASVLDHYLREHALYHVTDLHRQVNAAANLIDFMGAVPVWRIDIPLTRSYAEARRSGIVGGGGGLRRQRWEATNATITRELGVLVAAARHAVRWRLIGKFQLPSVEYPSSWRFGAVWRRR